MSRFLINRLVVASPQSRKARRIDFHPKCTVITGPNDTGKSSLIKTLVHAFGTEPRMLKEWRDEVAKILVYFTVDGRSYKILREGETFSVFGEHKAPLGVFNSVSKELGPWLAELLKFGIKLTDQSGTLITPPPAFLLLPYYFDQDTSWHANWNGFSKLEQIKNWRKDLIDYHVGLKPNEYYSTKGDQIKARDELAKLDAAQKVLKGVRDQIASEYKEVNFTIDLEAFQEEIKELLVACARLQKEADKLKATLVGYYTDKMELESQIEVVSGALTEINSDYHFLETKADHIDCPTCGAAYQAGFGEVFGIAKDEGKCEHLLHSLREQLDVVVKEIDRMSTCHRQQEVEIAHIKSILDRRQAEVQLKDLIDAESKKKLNSVLKAKYEASGQTLFALVEKIHTLQQQLEAFVDKGRRTEIKTQFQQLMRRNLSELAVGGMSTKQTSDYTVKVLNQGSDQPRALLAYGFSILAVMHARTSAMFCPVIIDSPIQQEQDVPNHHKIVTFIRDRIPTDAQLILGIVDDKGVDFGGDVLRLSDKRSVLREDEFEEAYAEIAPFLKASMEFELS